MGVRKIQHLVLATVCLGLAWAALGQEGGAPQRVEIPAGAVRIEGTPRVRIDTTETSSTRHVLDTTESAAHRLNVAVRDGRYYLPDQPDRPLEFNAAGAYTLLSARPGSYIKFTKINDRISYVEHLDEDFRSVTYWGELRIVLGK